MKSIERLILTRPPGWLGWATRIGYARVAFMVLVLVVANLPLTRAIAGADPVEDMQRVRRATTGTTVGSVPASLQAVGEYGEHVYDAAKLRNWSETAVDLKRLKAAMRQMRSDLRSAPEFPQLDTAVTALENAVRAKDRQSAMLQANDVTIIAADMAAPFHPTVPIAVVRLDYLGRELEIWAEARDVAKLQTTATDLERTWESVNQAVEDRGAVALSKEFGDLVARVRSARSPAEFSQLASSVLEAVDRLESVFKK
jgi:hypothetical protein